MALLPGLARKVLSAISRAMASKPSRSASRRATLIVEQLETRRLLSTATMNLAPSLVGQASPGSSGLTPAQITTAYGFTLLPSSVNGSNVTIAIIDAYNDPDIQADLAAFSAEFGLPYSSSTLQVLNQTGGTALPPVDPASKHSTDDWEDEIDIDVEWAHAIAPLAHIVLYEANSSSTANLYQAVQTAANNPAVSVVSMSWGGTESSSQTQLDSYFQTPAGHQGITFIASAGDSGVVETPSSSPNVLSVGGTTLTLNANSSIASETAWSWSSKNQWGGGGGFSKFEKQPWYQAGIGGTTRGTPDLAYDADPDTGFWVYDEFNDAKDPWGVWGGTSDGAPQVAGLVALADQIRLDNGLGTLNGPTQTIPLLYYLTDSSGDFHDITSGSNLNGSAGPGWDVVTGWGSPVANNLVESLASFNGFSYAIQSGTLSATYGATTKAVSMGISSAAVGPGAILYELTTSGALEEQQGGVITQLNTGVVSFQVSAGGTLYDVTTGGALQEYVNGAWTTLATGVTTGNTVYFVSGTGASAALYEVVDGNISAVPTPTAGETIVSSVTSGTSLYVLYSGGELYQYNGNTGSTLLNVGVTVFQLSAGGTLYDVSGGEVRQYAGTSWTNLASGATTSGTTIYYVTGTTLNEVVNGVVSAVTAPTGAGTIAGWETSGATMYVLYSNGALYEYNGATATSLNAGVASFQVTTAGALYDLTAAGAFQEYVNGAWTTLATGVTAEDTVYFVSGTGASAALYEVADGTLSSVPLPNGAGTIVSSASYGTSLYVLYSNGGLYQYTGNSTTLLNTGVTAIQLSAGGALYDVSGGNFEQYTGSNWTILATGVTSGNTIYYVSGTGAGATLYQIVDGVISTVTTPTGAGTIASSATSGGTIYVLYSGGALYEYNGGTATALNTGVVSVQVYGGNVYDLTTGGAFQEYTGSGTTWTTLATGVMTSNTVYFVSGTGAAATLYEIVDGVLSTVAAPGGGTIVNATTSGSNLYVLYSTGALYDFSAAGATQLDSGVTSFQVSSAGTLYDLNSGNFQEHTGSGWITLATGVTTGNTVFYASGSTINEVVIGGAMTSFTAPTGAGSVVSALQSGTTFYVLYSGGALYKYSGSSATSLNTGVASFQVSAAGTLYDLTTAGAFQQYTGTAWTTLAAGVSASNTVYFVSGTGAAATLYEIVDEVLSTIAAPGGGTIVSSATSGSNLYVLYTTGALYDFGAAGATQLDSGVTSFQVSSSGTLYDLNSGTFQVHTGSGWTMLATSVTTGNTVFYASGSTINEVVIGGAMTSFTAPTGAGSVVSTLQSGTTFYVLYSGGALYKYSGSAATSLNTGVASFQVSAAGTLYDLTTAGAFQQYTGTGTTWTTLATAVTTSNTVYFVSGTGASAVVDQVVDGGLPTAAPAAAGTISKTITSGNTLYVLYTGGALYQYAGGTVTQLSTGVSSFQVTNGNLFALTSAGVFQEYVNGSWTTLSTGVATGKTVFFVSGSGASAALSQIVIGGAISSVTAPAGVGTISSWATSGTTLYVLFSGGALYKYADGTAIGTTNPTRLNTGVASFEVSPAGTLYDLTTAGAFQQYSGSGTTWTTLATGVTAGSTIFFVSGSGTSAVIYEVTGGVITTFTLPTGAGTISSTLTFGTTFYVLYSGGALYQYSGSTATPINTGVASFQISGGLLFDLTTTGAFQECVGGSWTTLATGVVAGNTVYFDSGSAGSTVINQVVVGGTLTTFTPPSGFGSIAASQQVSSTLYVLYGSGALYKYSGSTATSLNASVASFQVSAAGTVYDLTTGGAFQEYVSGTTWTTLATGVTTGNIVYYVSGSGASAVINQVVIGGAMTAVSPPSGAGNISSSLASGSTLYVLFSNGALYQYSGGTATSLNTGVASFQVSGGNLFDLTTTGAFQEYAGSSWTTLATGVTTGSTVYFVTGSVINQIVVGGALATFNAPNAAGSITTTATYGSTLYVLYANGALYEYGGSGATALNTGVASFQVSSSGTLFDLTTGGTFQEYVSGSWATLATGVTSGDVVYYVSGSGASAVINQLVTGGATSTVTPPGGAGTITTSLNSGNDLYVAYSTGVLYEYSTGTATAVTPPIGASTISSAVASGSTLYVLYNNGALYGYNAGTATPLDSGVTSFQVSAAGTLYDLNAGTFQEYVNGSWTTLATGVTTGNTIYHVSGTTINQVVIGGAMTTVTPPSGAGSLTTYAPSGTTLYVLYGNGALYQYSAGTATSLNTGVASFQLYGGNLYDLTTGGAFQEHVGGTTWTTLAAGVTTSDTVYFVSGTGASAVLYQVADEGLSAVTPPGGAGTITSSLSSGSVFYVVYSVAGLYEYSTGTGSAVTPPVGASTISSAVTSGSTTSGTTLYVLYSSGALYQYSAAVATSLNPGVTSIQLSGSSLFALTAAGAFQEYASGQWTTLAAGVTTGSSVYVVSGSSISKIIVGGATTAISSPGTIESTAITSNGATLYVLLSTGTLDVYSAGSTTPTTIASASIGSPSGPAGPGGHGGPGGSGAPGGSSGSTVTAIGLATDGTLVYLQGSNLFKYTGASTELETGVSAFAIAGDTVTTTLTGGKAGTTYTV